MIGGEVWFNEGWMLRRFLPAVRWSGNLRQALCVLAGVVHTACQQAPVKLPEDDLVRQARKWRQQDGLKTARDRLVSTLETMDAGGGAFEQRLLRANGDKSFAFTDSMAGFTTEQRSRTGIYFLCGFHTASDLSKRVAANVVESLCRQGWHARLIDLKPHETVQQDARRVQAALEKELPQVDRAVVSGFSKGGLDWMQWFAHEAEKLPARERAKMRLMLSFAGVLRGSMVADWLYRGWPPFAHTTRLYVRLFDPDGSKVIEDVRSVSQDPWIQEPPPRLREMAPGLRVVSLVAVPDGPRGHPHAHLGFNLLSRFVATQWRWVGPLDGMTESASQVLPPGSGVEQHLVRVLGSHALLDGHYLNGAKVSAAFHQKNGDPSRGGEELLDDLLRSLPRAWVMP